MNLSSFLTALTDFLNQQKIPYAFARNHKDLPDHKESGDIDLVVPPQAIETIIDWLLDHKEIKFLNRQNRSYVVNTMLGGINWGKDQQYHALQLDLLHRFRYKGIDFLKFDDIKDGISSADNQPGYIRTLTRSDQFILTFFSALITGGQVKDRYWRQWRDLFSKDLPMAQKSRLHLENNFGEKITAALIKRISGDQRAQLYDMLPKLRSAFLWRKLKEKGPLAFFYMAAHYGREILLMLSARHTFTAELPINDTQDDIVQLSAQMTHAAKKIDHWHNPHIFRWWFFRHFSRQTHLLLLTGQDPENYFGMPPDIILPQKDLTKNSGELRDLIFQAMQNRQMGYERHL